MKCVHTHHGMPTIEECDNPSHIWNTVEKIRENNWKVGKIGWTISQMFALKLEHDKIRKQCASIVSRQKTC
jgi:hypothetical protein